MRSTEKVTGTVCCRMKHTKDSVTNRNHGRLKFILSRYTLKPKVTIKMNSYVVADCTVPPKSKTGQGLNFIINQEKYLKVFLEGGDVPVDNSVLERVIRTFCIGKKNWMFHNTANGAS